MNARRGGLGKGLGALIPTGPPPAQPASPATAPAASPGPGPVTTAEPPAEPSAVPAAPAAAPAGAEPEPVPGATFRELPVYAIKPNARQPRTVFDDEPLEELKTSIREIGMLQPVVVRPIGGGEYELVVGERRWRAVSDLGLETIPAIVRETGDDAMLRDALLENLHRVQLNPLEEAAAYRQLLDEFGTTHEELAQRIGRSRSQVTNTIRLLNLPVPVQRRVAASVLTAGHARALLSLDDAEAQEELATRIVAEGLSVRAVEELVSLAVKESKPDKPKAARGQRVTAPALTDLADRLSDTFDTRVKVELGRRKGKIVVEFGSVDDLERIIGLMAPTVGPRGSSASKSE
jgi:ParB family transcriptional regulator, chromosome partitioning protein